MYVKIIWLQIGGRCKWSLQRRRVGEVAYSSKRAAIPADSMTKINFYFHKQLIQSRYMEVFLSQGDAPLNINLYQGQFERILLNLQI